jgi:hypothetical protein
MAQYGQKLRRLRFEKIILEGENPKGFTAQTANGTAKVGPPEVVQPGWNRQWDWSMPQTEPVPPWNGNRTGE